MTNYEWIRSMEIERFAEFIAGFEYCDYCRACDDERAVCKNGFKSWLEKEHIEAQLVKE